MRNDLKRFKDDIKTKKIPYICQVCGEITHKEVPEHLVNENISLKTECKLCEDDTAFRVIVTDPRILGE